MKDKLTNISIRTRIFLTTMVIIVVILAISNTIIYSSFSNTHQDLIEETSTEVNKQVVLNFENYLSTVIDSAHLLRIETLNYSRADDYDSLENVYQYIVQIDRNVSAIFLIDMNGDPVISTIPMNQLQSNFINEPYFQNAITDDTIFHFAPPALQTHIEDSDENVITVSRLVQYYEDGIRQQAVLVMDLRAEQIIRLANDTNLGENGHILLIDDDNDLIFDPSNYCLDDCQSLEAIENLYLGGMIIEDGEDALYAHVNTLKYTRWKIASFSDINVVNDTRQSVLMTFGIIFGGSIIVTALAAMLMSGRISKPLDRLKSQMVSFQTGQMAPIVPIKGQKEVVLLSEAFNEMAKEISRLMDRVYEEQRAKRKTHFQALQNQINPHFLYNTLDSILYLSEDDNNEAVQKMVTALSKFFRLSISNESGEVRLNEEIEHVRNYLLIQQIRYHKVFTFTIDCEEQIKPYKVLKLSLQPLVENAISHGIDPNSKDNVITINCYEKKGFIYAEVKNTGYGLTPSQIDDVYNNMTDTNESENIGLKNIYQRMKLQFGLTANVIIESKLDYFTIVTLKYPIKKDVE